MQVPAKAGMGPGFPEPSRARKWIEIKIVSIEMILISGAIGICPVGGMVQHYRNSASRWNCAER
jgi:hypothetical protein